ncbi:alpha-L-arabinofuranosidase [Amycolatopsis mediterranei S699]|uniref:Alpha-L-arabinofuranosidase n=2 Tax=Amycolatopsis mediterranei TaxID=33910 RepID=A0A0H3D4C1_AMYMU|nr:arabinofuranosidase catalytic domain-containing protein [Amycolatopsis mediterranei]ADJ45081.1 alpha-L-arabinofuranosidase [Amycolatopsis mediterranei U32]AEK41837.1 alpha-L-arabinofuranosidase [Amycolatopsis mediterranei S699]AFO76792.1 alpha-L-arabinofuranosidase [Amycolatopsis mediterranei S699]AGT83920.1 alpha-L-arabinofuranosidase [Amycolatopsis mediterranei RB]KDO08721.1 alpha-L-arabinofuranosidase [Amycolatopsis mediterranei]
MVFRKRSFRRALQATAAALLLTAGAVAATAPTAQAATPQACDLYATGGTPCVTAHSTTRALFGAYNGPLYQIQRASDQKYLDIGLLEAGGYADSAPQVSFCAGTRCTVTKIYDQTANHNDLPISWGGFWKGPGPNGSDVGADAMALPVTVAGHPVYGIKVTQGVGYRIDNARNVPVGAQPEGIYMITSSNYVNQWCCFDYGSGEISHNDTGNATMNAIYWGTACWFNGCTGTGPWVEADLENGMYHTGTGSNKDPNNPGVHHPFVSAWEKNNGTSNFTLKYGDATTGGLTTPYSGGLPRGYSPMKLEPSILLGTGGDNSVSGVGEFFEGAVTSGFPTDATENAVQASVVAAGYNTGGSSTTTGAVHAVGANKCLDVSGVSTTPGTQVQIWDCNGGTNQTWTRSTSSELTVYDGGNMRCLDASGKGTSPGTKVIIWNCNGQNNQQWTFNANGTVTGVQSGLCLDVTGSGTANGTLTQLATCTGANNQKWSLS